MLVRFWGVRGSVPWATADSIGHGCNTPCVEISDERTGALLVLDAGSGIVGLGEALGGPTAPGANPADPLPLGSHPGAAVFLALFSARMDAVGMGAEADRRVAGVGADDLRLTVLSRAVRSFAEQADGDARQPGEIRDRWISGQRAAVEPPWRRVRVSDSWRQGRCRLRHRS